jgi:hypothetical protein
MAHLNSQLTKKECVNFLFHLRFGSRRHCCKTCLYSDGAISWSVCHQLFVRVGSFPSCLNLPQGRQTNSLLQQAPKKFIKMEFPSKGSFTQAMWASDFAERCNSYLLGIEITSLSKIANPTSPVWTPLYLRLTCQQAITNFAFLLFIQTAKNSTVVTNFKK